MITPNQKPVIDLEKIKKSKHITKENHQTTKGKTKEEKSNGRSTKQPGEKNKRKKMAIST